MFGRCVGERIAVLGFNSERGVIEPDAMHVSVVRLRRPGKRAPITLRRLVFIAFVWVRTRIIHAHIHTHIVVDK